MTIAWLKISPFLHPAALAKLKAAGGEVAYDSLLTARTEEWIRQHPAGALKIAARHVREFYFPSRWMLPAVSPILVQLKQAAIWAIAFVGFMGLGVGLARKNWRFLYVAAPLLLLMLPYVLGQPVPRYSYPVGGLLVFLAADMTWRASKSMWSRLSWRPHPTVGRLACGACRRRYSRERLFLTKSEIDAIHIPIDGILSGASRPGREMPVAV